MGRRVGRERDRPLVGQGTGDDAEGPEGEQGPGAAGGPPSLVLI